MRRSIIISIIYLFPLLVFSQDNTCENISFDISKEVSETVSNLILKVSISDKATIKEQISYPGLILKNEKGEIVAQTSENQQTYGLYDGIDYEIEIVKDIPDYFTGTLEIYSGFFGEFSTPDCIQSVSFGKKFACSSSKKEETSTVNIQKIIYLEYKGNDERGAGRIKKISDDIWYEYAMDSSAIIGEYKETHRDENYIYLIGNEAIFQFDILNNKIIKNGVDVLDISSASSDDVEIKSTLHKD